MEEAGREARYEAFAAESARFGDGARVALAHHMEDNAETVLFHMCRGSGMAGIAGIAPVRGNIIRPLLCVTRAEIKAGRAAFSHRRYKCGRGLHQEPDQGARHARANARQSESGAAYCPSVQGGR